MATLRKSWGKVFTDDEDILSFNCNGAAGCGPLRARKLPSASLGVTINLRSFYGIGLPLALILGFGFGKGSLGL